MKTVRRTIHPEVKILDAAGGVACYIASNETLDSYGEVIRAAGWKFDRFEKNSPFVDSHQYDTIERLLGTVTDFEIKGDKLVETVQWAIDSPDNRLARIGWQMTMGGHLKAVSVGFYPTKTVTKWDSDKSAWKQQLDALGLHEEDGIRAVYVEQQQIELSAVIIGANPDALLTVGKAFKAGLLVDADLQFLAGDFARRATASAAVIPGPAAHEAKARARQRFLDRIDSITRTL